MVINEKQLRAHNLHVFFFSTFRCDNLSAHKCVFLILTATFEINVVKNSNPNNVASFSIHGDTSTKQFSGRKRSLKDNISFSESYNITLFRVLFKTFILAVRIYFTQWSIQDINAHALQQITKSCIPYLLSKWIFYHTTPCWCKKAFHSVIILLLAVQENILMSLYLTCPP